MKTTQSKRVEPREGSQEFTILKHLKRGWKISTSRAVHLYEICRVSAVVLRLKEKGWKIRTIDVKKKNEPGTFGEYKLIRS